MTITAVTPWLEHHELAEDYIAAIVGADEVIIIDNGNAPVIPGAKVLTPACNLGFSKASNVGLRAATCDAVLFLNNDISVIRTHWLEEIREALEPGYIVGPMRDRDFPYIDGWCLAGMREDLLEIGGFDETLEEPAYFSDNLLCLEARARGMSLRDVRVGLRHKLNSTAGPAWDDRVRAATQINQARYEARVRELLTAVD